MNNVDNRLRPMQDEVKRLLSEIAPLQMREQALVREREKIAPVLSPWRRLPNEILAEIMQEVVNPSSPSFLSDTNTSTDRNQFKAIRQVSRLWRQVALTTHSLWTSVWVDFDRYAESEIPKLIQSIKHYFSHSGPTLRLNIGFKWRRQLNPDSIQPTQEGYPFDPWLDYLFSMRNRWEEITFFTQAYHFQLFQAKLRSDVDLGLSPWKTLFIQVSTLPECLTEPPRLQPLANGKKLLEECFPILETINLSSEDDVLPLEGHLALLDGHQNLRKLRLDIYRDMNPYFSKLHGLKNLKKLLINCPKLSITPPDRHSIPVFEFPSLELLVVSCMPSFTFLSKLMTPSLVTLQILTNIPPSRNPHTTSLLQKDLWDTFDEVIAFVKQCETTLREFHLNAWFMKGDDSLRKLLESLSSVERLCLDTWFLPHKGHADDSLENSTYLPRLKKFCLHAIDSRTKDLLRGTPLDAEDAEGEGEGDEDEEGSAHGDGEDDTGGDTDGDDDDTAGAGNAVDAHGAGQAAPQGNEIEEWDPEKPFARKDISWASLGAFLMSVKDRAPKTEKTESGASGSGHKSNCDKFTVCIPEDYVEEVGWDAISVVDSLTPEFRKLNYERVASCKIFW